LKLTWDFTCNVTGFVISDIRCSGRDTRRTRTLVSFFRKSPKADRIRCWNDTGTNGFWWTAADWTVYFKSNQRILIALFSKCTFLQTGNSARVTLVTIVPWLSNAICDRRKWKWFYFYKTKTNHNQNLKWKINNNQLDSFLLFFLRLFRRSINWVYLSKKLSIRTPPQCWSRIRNQFNIVI